MICRTKQWAGFYMMGTSIMKVLIYECVLTQIYYNKVNLFFLIPFGVIQLVRTQNFPKN